MMAGLGHFGGGRLRDRNGATPMGDATLDSNHAENALQESGAKGGEMIYLGEPFSMRRDKA